MGTNRLVGLIGSNGKIKRMACKVAFIVLYMVISFILVIAASALSLYVLDLTKGRNVSDIGIPMYTNMKRAYMLAFISYILVITVFFFLCSWLWKDPNFIHVYAVLNGCILLAASLFIMVFFE